MDDKFEHRREDAKINVYLKGGVLIGSARCIERKQWAAYDQNSTSIGTGTKRECVELVKKNYRRKAGV